MTQEITQNLTQAMIPKWKVWLLAIRPRTLSISLVPIIIATVMASSQVQSLNWPLICLCLFCSLCVQIGTNLVNDASDFKKGADEHRHFGSLRVTQAGLLSYNAVQMVGCICFILAGIFGIPLIYAGGWPLFLVLLFSIACGYFYTAGPFPLAYLGCSDIFILIFFGWVSACSVFYLQTGDVSLMIVIASTQIGCLAIVPHAINNLRDYASDALVNKKTLAVRFGKSFVKKEIVFFSIFPFLLGLFWIFNGNLWIGLLPIVSLPFILLNLKAIWYEEPSQRYNQYLATSAMCQFLFGCLLALGILLW